MKTLTLFRHAKSRRKNDSRIEDIDRPLSARGLKAAPKIGAFLRERRLRPNLILCSPSARTRQTLSLAAATAWDNPPRLRFEPRLYEASEDELLKIVHALPEDASHVMLVAHNPGLQDLAVELSEPLGDGRNHLKDKLPTAAVASFDFSVEAWKLIEEGTGRLRVYIDPSMLPSVE